MLEELDEATRAQFLRQLADVERRYEADPVGQRRRYARAEMNLRVIRERLREFPAWNESAELAEACHLIDGMLEWAGGEVREELPWLAWAMSVAGGAWVRECILRRYGQTVADAFFEPDAKAVLSGDRALLEPPAPGERAQ
jgi:hypothetical protein